MSHPWYLVIEEEGEGQEEWGDKGKKRKTQIKKLLDLQTMKRSFGELWETVTEIL